MHVISAQSKITVTQSRPNTFQNGNLIRYNPKEYSQEYFQPKIRRKIRIYSLGQTEKKFNRCII